MRHTRKHYVDCFCGDQLDAMLYSSGGVTHTVEVTHPDGHVEKHSFKGQHAARKFIEEKVLMIVTSSPHDYARQRLAFWEQRLKTAEAMPVERRAGAWPNKAAKSREVLACKAAIMALKEVTEANYA